MREDQIQKLDELNNESFEKFVSAAVSVLSTSTVTFSDQAAEVAGEVQLPLEAATLYLQDVSSAISEALRSHSQSHHKSFFINLGFSENKASILSSWVEANAATLTHNALHQTLAVNQLVDMDWKFGVTAASSDVEKLGNTFLQLKLTIRKGNQLEPVYFELSLAQFYTFLHEMEKAKASMDLLV